MQSLDQKMSKAGKSLSLKVTAPLVALGAASWKMAGDFDTSFRKVNVMLGASSEQAKEYKKDILAISDATGKSAVDTTDAFYQIVSAGFRGADAIDVLNVALKGAVGGAADATQTTAALTKAMNIFALEGVEGANQAMDTFFGIVDAGLLTFEEMANSFPRAATTAATLGISIEETGAALATLSKVAGSTEQASTGLAAIFGALLKPSVDLEKVYQSWGVKTGPEAIEMFGGLEGVLAKLKEETEKTGGAMITDLVPSLEASRLLAPLLTTSFDEFGNALVTIADSTGKTGKAFDEMTQGPGFALTEMINKLRNASIKLGDAVANVLSPIIGAFVDVVSGLADTFSKLPSFIKTAIIAFGILAAAIGPVLLITAQLIKAYKSMTTVFPIAAKAMKGLAVATKLLGLSVKQLMAATGIGAVVVILGLLVHAMMQNEEVMGRLRAAFDEIMVALQPLLDAFGDAFSQIMGSLKPAFDALAKVLGMVAGVMAGTFSKIITKVINVVLPPLVWIIEKVAFAMTKWVETATWVWSEIKKVFLKGVSDALGALTKFIGWVPWLGDKVKDAKEAIDNMIDGDNLAAEAAIAAKGLSEAMGEIAGGVVVAEEAVEGLADTVVGSFDDMVKAAEEASEETIKALKEQYGDVLGYVTKNEKSKLALLEKSHKSVIKMLNKELEAARKAYYERIKILNEEYDAKMRNLDEETKSKLYEYQRQIDDIEAKTEAEERAVELAERAKRVQDLETAVQQAETREERLQAQTELEEELVEQNRVNVLEKRDAEIEAIQEAMTEVENKAEAEKTVLGEELAEKERIESDKLKETEGRLAGEITAQEQHLIDMRTHLADELAEKIKLEGDKLQAFKDRLTEEAALAGASVTTTEPAVGEEDTGGGTSGSDVSSGSGTGEYQYGSGGSGVGISLPNPQEGDIRNKVLGSSSQGPTFGATEIFHNGQWVPATHLYNVWEPAGGGPGGVRSEPADGGGAVVPAFNLPDFNAAVMSPDFWEFAKGGVVKRPSWLLDMASKKIWGSIAEEGPERVSPIQNAVRGVKSFNPERLDSGRGVSDGATNNINIDTMVVREEADIYKIARELEVLHSRTSRTVGR